MRKKAIIFLVTILAACSMISAVFGAEVMISGVAKSFDAKSGRLVLQTAPQRESTFSIPQTVKVYLRVKGKDTEVADEWRLLQDNLMKGTKVQILKSEGTVITIWIMEVPR